MNKNLKLVAIIEIKPGHLETVKAELVKLLEPTRTEEGCIQYDLHQDNENPNVFVFLEEWVNKDFLEKHTKNDHLVAFGKATSGLIENFTVHEMTEI